MVCPTRELAIQVAGEAEKFGKHMGLRTVLAYGGTSSGHQKQELEQGCDLLVATPGRLLDFMTGAWVSLRRVKFLVLDEADRMLDMGFINDIDAIVRRAPMSRQTMLFSATFPEDIRRLSERYLLHPETVRIDLVVTVKESVEHAFLEVAERQKEDLLLALLDRERPQKCLVFTATREKTSELARRLRTRNHEVVSLSSLLSQANRERALDAFRKGEFDVLVATDVAARGLDIDDIDLVVNFDVPMHAEEYVHRIGRTGRAERTGKAFTLVSEFDARRAAQIEGMLGHPVERRNDPGVRLSGGPRRRRSGAWRRAWRRSRRGAGGIALRDGRREDIFRGRDEPRSAAAVAVAAGAIPRRLPSPERRPWGPCGSSPDASKAGAFASWTSQASRPTGDRVREALFNILGQDLGGASVLDLFAGTGALGFEAASRGARRVVFVEADRGLARRILAQAEEFGLGRDARVVVGRVEDSLDPQRLGGPFDLVLADPPYGQEVESPLVRQVESAGLLAPDGTLVVERDSHDPEAPGAASLGLARTARYGRAALDFFKFS